MLKLKLQYFGLLMCRADSFEKTLILRKIEGRKMCWRRDGLPTPVFLGFPGGSADKESTCNAGNLGSIPGSGRSHGEGILQYSWTSLVVQSLKNLPAMQEPGFNPWFGKPGGGNGNPHQYSCLENPHGQRSLAGCSPWGCKELDTGHLENPL